MLYFNWSPPLGGGRMGLQHRVRVPAPTHPALALKLTCLVLRPPRSALTGLASTPTVPASASAPVLYSP